MILHTWFGLSTKCLLIRSLLDASTMRSQLRQARVKLQKKREEKATVSSYSCSLSMRYLAPYTYNIPPVLCMWCGQYLVKIYLKTNSNQKWIELTYDTVCVFWFSFLQDLSLEKILWNLTWGKNVLQHDMNTEGKGLDVQRLHKTSLY